MIPDDVDRPHRMEIIESIKRVDDRGIDDMIALLTDIEVGE